MKHILLIMALLGLSACATVNNSSVDHFRVDSVPQGAKVTTTIETDESLRKKRSGREYTPEYYGCEPTPCAIAFKRNQRFIAKITHPGYEPAEIFIQGSTHKGAFAGNMVATTATVAGTTAATAAVTAAMAALATEIAAGITVIVAHVFTFGVFPVSSTAITVAPAASTGSVMAASVPPAIAVTGGMLLVDAASGANKNLYPNPVVLGLAKEGEPSKTDPLAVFFKEELRLKDVADELCHSKLTSKKEGMKACQSAKSDVTKIRKKQKDIMKLIYQAQKEAYKAEQAAKRAAKKSPPAKN